jgi:excinuclease ABC C subunit
MRSCQDIDAHIAARRECLDFHIGRCTGPCIAMQTQAEYRAMVEQFCDFLAGKREHVVKTLQRLQTDAAARREYERAGRIRDQVRGIESILARQRVVDLSGPEADVVGVARQGEAACAVIFKVRERRVLSRDVRWLSGAGNTDESELLRAFLTLYYTRAEQVPGCVLVEVEPEETELLEEVLSTSSGTAVRLRTPRGLAERALVRTARRNASLLLGRESDEGDGARPLRANEFEEALELQRELGLAHLPRRIRCFDVSTIQGRHTVASMVTFRDGTPFKGEYRRFRIASVPGQDDFASMAEAVGRHAARVQEGEIEPADLVVIDGGAGQLEAARGAARGTPLQGVPFIGLAKRLEEIFIPGRRDSLVLPRRSPAVKLLMRIRDEAHRFAIGYHRLVRTKAARASALDGIPGLGPKRRAPCPTVRLAGSHAAPARGRHRRGARYRAPHGRAHPARDRADERSERVSGKMEVAWVGLRSELGPVWILATQSGLRGLGLGSREAPSTREARALGIHYVKRPRWTDPARRALEAYFEGRSPALDLKLDLAEGSRFERRVWDATRRIPYGAVVSYGGPGRLGLPEEPARGNALKESRPDRGSVSCVIHGDRSIGGFSSGFAEAVPPIWSAASRSRWRRDPRSVRGQDPLVPGAPEPERRLGDNTVSLREGPDSTMPSWRARRGARARAGRGVEAYVAERSWAAPPWRERPPRCGRSMVLRRRGLGRRTRAQIRPRGSPGPPDVPTVPEIETLLGDAGRGAGGDPRPGALEVAHATPG